MFVFCFLGWALYSTSWQYRSDKHTEQRQYNTVLKVYCSTFSLSCLHFKVHCFGKDVPFSKFILMSLNRFFFFFFNLVSCLLVNIFQCFIPKEPSALSSGLAVHIFCKESKKANSAREEPNKRFEIESPKTKTIWKHLRFMHFLCRHIFSRIAKFRFSSKLK